MRQIISLGAVLLLTFALTMFFWGSPDSSSSGDISPTRAEALIASADLLIIDVREPYEFAAGHIPQAINIPLGTLASHVVRLDQDKSFLLVCRSGNRSGQAKRLLVSKGFTKVYNLQGGMLGWRGSVVR